MRRTTLLVLFALVVVLPAVGLSVVGCQVAAETSASSTTAKPVQAAEGTVVSSTATTHSSTTAKPVQAAKVPRSIDEQRQRFEAVSDLAQHYGWAAIDYKALQSPDWNAELIVYGTVVKVDPARWNTPDGRQPLHAGKSADDNPVIYTTFYVQPTEMKGSPRFGTPIAIMVPYHDELLAEGDEVLVFAEYGEMWGPGTWKQDAYFSVEEVRGIYMKVGEQYLNIESGAVLPAH